MFIVVSQKGIVVFPGFEWGLRNYRGKSGLYNLIFV